MPNIVDDVSSINMSEVKVTTPTRNASGGLNANLWYNGERLCFATPKMVCPFGISKFETDKDGKSTPKYSLDLSFRGMQTDEKIAEFHSFLLSLDNIVIESALGNSENWFGKKMDHAVLSALVSASVRESPPKMDRNGQPIKYPATFRSKISHGLANYNTEAFNSRQEPIDPLSINKGDSVMAIIEVVGVYFMNRKRFGISYKIYQMMVFPSNLTAMFQFSRCYW
jgi:hypothetical protein